MSTTKQDDRLAREAEFAQMDMRDAYFDTVYEIAAGDESVVFLTDDMDAFSLRRFKTDFPDRFINIGVAEQNMINLATGLALSGKRVFTYGIAPFVTMRCFEQIKVNLCSMQLPVTIVGVGAGFSFAFDGPTHHGLHDLAMMRVLPELEIYNPSDAASAAECARQCYRSDSPVYVRLDKGTFPVLPEPEGGYAQGYRIVRPLRDVNVIASGFMTSLALQAVDLLAAQEIHVGLVDLYRVKPISSNLASEILGMSKTVVTVEESSVQGGVGTAIAEVLSDKNLDASLVRVGAEDRQFIQYGTREWFHELNGLDVPALAQKFANAVVR